MKSLIISIGLIFFLCQGVWADSLNNGVVDTPSGVSFPNGIDTDNTLDWESDVATVHEATGIDTHESLTSCEASVNTGNPALLDIANCWYHVKGPQYFLNATTINPNFLAGENSSFIGATMNGYTTQISDWSIAQLKTTVPVARVNTEHGDAGPGSAIYLIRHDHYFLGERDARDKTYFSRVFGAQYVKGGELFANATSLTLGQYLNLSANEINYVTSKKSLIADNYYYNPAGSNLIPLSNTNKYKADTVLKSPKGANGLQEGGWFYLYGTQEFDTAAEAKAEALTRFGVFVNPATSSLVPLALVIINRDATTVEEVIDRRRCFVCRAQ
jgi:hypothetical protein